MFCYKSLALISKVLFEITLLQEWKKLLAAQILQRTLLVYISIKNNFFLILGVGLSAFPSVPPPFFEVGKWCKGKCYFSNHQIFSKDFSEFFQNLFSYRFEPCVAFEAGAKVSHFSESPKDFGTFSKFFRTCFYRFRAVFLSRSGCKDKDFSRQLPNNSGTFFRQFSRLFLTRLWISELVVKIF